MKRALIALAALILLVSSAQGASTFTVQAGGSIQSAISAAQPGDTILVEPGVYAPFTITKDNLVIRSTVKWGAVIDGNGVPNGVTAASGADGWTCTRAARTRR